ncbi:long-chain specific acyl-CoA dehydrogenase, mitochondrial-like isoform X2 [Ostrea edulis]|uniref:long-chain specific acyl-CoA dehydrogenase, mitochondrial-like isoform X2 n=1 Tax=Ostrea edulis TaxID=37623 RepID=UPI002094976D|nr:long-chain specific acyl-CoA dehydrogenase, mitochondrial-like isoform X2 [Ostrea edulis]
MAAYSVTRCMRFGLFNKRLLHVSRFSTSIKRHGEVRPEVSQASNMMDIGARGIFSAEHDLFRQNVRRFFQEEVLPHHTKWEKDGQVSREVWEKAGQNGLLGVNTKEELGGIGGDVLSTAITWEEQMYVNCSGPGFSLHSDIIMPYISHYGTKEQIEKFIPRMTAGTCIGAIGMTEPGAGSDLQGIRTNAKKDGSDYILNGSKVFITNGWMSDLVIVVAITNPEAKSKAHGISLFLVEEGMKGFVKGRKLEKIGLKAQDTAELFFEDVRLPKESLLGEENKGFYYLMQELPQERLIIADMAIANSEWMFEETRNYVRQRKAFGKTISNLQTVQHKLAEIKTEVAVGRAFLDQCLKIHNERGLDSVTASMAKYWATDLQNSIATRCLQLHGGWGYMWEYPIARAFVDSRVQPIYGGSNEIMKELIARTIVSDK